jgi:hypothetical protein
MNWEISMNKLIIDRFEGSFAICESDDKRMLQIPKYKLPTQCKEGDCIILNANGIYEKDKAAMTVREREIKEKFRRLFK